MDKRIPLLLLALIALPLTGFSGITIDWRAGTEGIGNGFNNDGNAGWDAFSGTQHDDFNSSGANAPVVAAIGNAAIESWVQTANTVVYDGGETGVDINSWNNQYGGADLGTALFEIWFRPDDLADRDLIFETGGTEDGTGIVLDGSVLKFGMSSGNGGTDAYAVTQIDLQQFIDNHGFTLGTDYLKASARVVLTSNRVELNVADRFGNDYDAVNSIIGGGGGTVVDWSGSDGGGLGRRSTSGAVGGNRADQYGAPNGSWTPFEGAIARFSFTTGVVPEPHTVGLLAIGMIAIRLGRHQRRVLGDDADLYS